MVVEGLALATNQLSLTNKKHKARDINLTFDPKDGNTSQLSC